MGCGYLNSYPMIASEKMAMGFHSFYPHGIGSTDLSQSHQPHSHHNIVSYFFFEMKRDTFNLNMINVSRKWNYKTLIHWNWFELIICANYVFQHIMILKQTKFISNHLMLHL